MNALVAAPETKKDHPSTSRRAPSRLQDVTPEPVRLGGPSIKLDGTAARLAWKPLPGADEYWIQVSDDARFETCYFDASVGDSAEVTLYETLPADGSRFHWRVRARTDAGWTSYSPSVAIDAVTDDEAQAWRAAVEARRAAEEKAKARARAARAEPSAVMPAPYLTGATSSVQSLVFVGVALGAFMLLAVIALLA